MATFEVEPLSSSIGAVIHGLDLNTLEQDQVELVTDLLQKHLVVFFRDQILNPESLFSLAKQFGQPVPYPFVPGLESQPEVIEVIKRPEETTNFGGVWHSDTTYLESPTMGALLYAVELPDHGGDTLFANMYKALELLSPGLSRFLESLSAVNDADNEAISATRPGQPKKNLTAVHPTIRTHPISGKPLLYVNRAHSTHFEGMTKAESAPILEYLFNLIERPEISCRFRWQPGSLAFWDNRACQHYPLNDYNGSLRKMLRISLSGDKPF